MRLIKVVSLLSLLLWALPGFAVTPQFWRVSSADELLGGEIEGMVVTSRGVLQPGPEVKKLASFTDPFVLCQVSDDAGNRYFGTGNAGKVYRLRNGELKLLYTAPEPEIYAIAYSRGALYVGTSPNGKVYRVDPSSGNASVYYDPKQAFIWALAPMRDGALAVATGVEGKLFRVVNGQGDLWYDTSETHLRSLAVTKENHLLVGGSGEGRIYEVSAKNQGRALYDSQFTEISSIFYDDATGTAWAAGAASVLPATAPAKTQQQQQKPANTTTGTAGSGGGGTQQQEQQSAPASVDVSFSFDDAGGGAANAGGGSSELYRIAADGFVEPVRKFDREIIYSLAPAGDGGVYISTGPLGRIYEFHNGEFSLEATIPEKQVVSFDRSGSTVIVTTTNNGAVYSLDYSGAGKAEFRSPVKDAERFSQFGSFSVEGNNIAASDLRISFRSGNTATPDETWSDWSSPVAATQGKVNAPAARYLQWRVTSAKPSPSMRIDSVSSAYVNRNVAPVIDAFAVLDPGVVVVSANFPASPQVLEATNPDENGMFNSLDTPRPPASDPGKKMFRKGYRTVTWKAHDPNGDSLRYTVNFRRKGTTQWMKIRDNVDESQVNFDSSQLPDGTYEIQLIASDAPDNVEAPLTDMREGGEFVVDNTAPRIEAQAGGSDVTVHVTDSASPIIRAEYSIDAKKWNRIAPVDGIADSTDETFRIPRSETDGHFVVMRVVDGSYNVATSQVSAPK